MIDMGRKDKKICFPKGVSFVVLTALCLIGLFSAVGCNANQVSDVPVTYASVTFKFSATAFTEGNVNDYRIQYRAIPLFGNKDTVGRATNWTDIEETEAGSGIAKIDRVQTGSWIFYVRVSDSQKTFIDVCTGTQAVTTDYTIVINEEDQDLSGYGTQDIYIRADYVYEGQKLLLEYQNTKDGTVVTIDQTDIEIVTNTRASVDYFLNTGKIPAGNYMVTAKILGENDVVVMSKEQPAEVRSTGTDALVMRLSAEAAVDGSLVIIGTDKLAGTITGPSVITLGEEAVYSFRAANTYTSENAVWYYWYADGKRYSTRETSVTIKFEYPGQYSISCNPIGINGEVVSSKYQELIEMKTKVNPTESEV